MKNKTLITAVSQGTTAHDKNGKVNLLKYADTYQAKSEYKNKNVQKTADNLHLNLVQRQMYRRLMYGLKEYSPEQIAAMTPSTITQVVNDYQKASKIFCLDVCSILKQDGSKFAQYLLLSGITPHIASSLTVKTGKPSIIL